MNRVRNRVRKNKTTQNKVSQNTIAQNINAGIKLRKERECRVRESLGCCSKTIFFFPRARIIGRAFRNFTTQESRTFIVRFGGKEDFSCAQK